MPAWNNPTPSPSSILRSAAASHSSANIRASFSSPANARTVRMFEIASSATKVAFSIWKRDHFYYNSKYVLRTKFSELCMELVANCGDGVFRPSESLRHGLATCSWDT